MKHMTKLLCLMLAVALFLSLTACGTKDKKDNAVPDAPAAASSVVQPEQEPETEEPTAEPEQKPESETPAEPEPETEEVSVGIEEEEEEWS